MYICIQGFTLYITSQCLMSLFFFFTYMYVMHDVSQSSYLTTLLKADTFFKFVCMTLNLRFKNQLCEHQAQNPLIAQFNSSTMKLAKFT